MVLDRSAAYRLAALVVGLTLAAVQQLGGVDTIMYYASTVMQQTGLSASNSIFYSVFIGAVNLMMTIVSLRMIDRLGRRPLLLGSPAGVDADPQTRWNGQVPEAVPERA